MFVEALVTELAVEAFDVAVLHGLAGVDQQVLDPVLLGPGDEGPAGELGTVIGAHGARVTAEAGRLVQQAHYIGTTDAVVDGDVHALAGEVVGDRQALDPASVGQRIADEVHAPHGVGSLQEQGSENNF